MYLALIEIRTDNISGDRHRMSDNETLNELCIKLIKNLAALYFSDGCPV
jgi:hypothetical protein